MGIDPKKYIVFKRDELIQLFGKYGLPTGDEDCAPVAQRILADVEADELSDAVVIRLQDAFAGTALHTYASTILTVMDLLTQMLAITPEETDRLTDLADYFAGLADTADTLAQQGVAKLPD